MCAAGEGHPPLSPWFTRTVLPECIKIARVFFTTQCSYYFVFFARMLPVGVALPHSPLENAFWALKQFLLWIADGTGRLNMIKEALQLVSTRYFQMLNHHHTLIWVGGWKAGTLENWEPQFCVRGLTKVALQLKQFTWGPCSRSWTLKQNWKHTQRNASQPWSLIPVIARSRQSTFLPWSRTLLWSIWLWSWLSS